MPREPIEFEKYPLVALGKRLANKYEAGLKLVARSHVWKEELGIGYDLLIQNSLGELYGDKLAHSLIYAQLDQKDFLQAEQYVERLYALRDSLLSKVTENPGGEFEQDFSRMLGYFFIIKAIFERVYPTVSPREQERIVAWRKEANLFSPLTLYYEYHPEKVQLTTEPWTWICREGVLELLPEIVSFHKEDAEELSSIELTGKGVYPGTIRGRIRRIMLPSEIHTMQEGEVLLAPMTTVEYTPIMQKAAAFVTDEGGITCHAAIVAREMKKPCIIGTKVATKLLKDGDLVEVDADNGTVRKL